MPHLNQFSQLELKKQKVELDQKQDSSETTIFLQLYSYKYINKD